MTTTLVATWLIATCAGWVARNQSKPVARDAIISAR
jgi:hypothetical protein